MRNRKIKVFYNQKQVCQDNILESSYSKSPLKPMLLMQYLQDNGFGDSLDIDSSFRPYNAGDFKLAHTKSYVKNFFAGKGNCGSNQIPWSKNLVESVTYTNASIFNAMKYSIENPETVTLSPTSGFHHAGPNGGSGFCTFSGQVIAATKIYRHSGKRAAFLDLDGHFGNSIEDSRGWVKDLDESIPFNINPQGTHGKYVEDLTMWLSELTNAFVNGEADYVVWCHGADSHEWDQLGHQVTTAEWLKCSELFYGWVAMMEEQFEIVVPVSMALFGGYRDDDYESVLSLHTSDLQICLRTLCGVDVEYVTQVKAKPTYSAHEGSWTTRSYIDDLEDEVAVEDSSSLDVWSSDAYEELENTIAVDPFGLRDMSLLEIIECTEEMTGERMQDNTELLSLAVEKAYELIIESECVR